MYIKNIFTYIYIYTYIQKYRSLPSTHLLLLSTHLLVSAPYWLDFFLFCMLCGVRPGAWVLVDWTIGISWQAHVAPSASVVQCMGHTWLDGVRIANLHAASRAFVSTGWGGWRARTRMGWNVWNDFLPTIIETNQLAFCFPFPSVWLKPGATFYTGTTRLWNSNGVHAH